MRRILSIIYIVLTLAIVKGGYARQATSRNVKQFAKIDSISKLAEELIRQSKFLKAQTLSQSSLAEAKKFDYGKGEGSALISLSNIAYAMRNFLLAEQYGKEAIDIFDKAAPDTMLAKSWVVWAKAVWAQSRFEEAVGAFEKARQFFDQRKDSTGVGDTYSAMAMAEEERGNYEQAFQYSTWALRYKNQWAWAAIGQLYADVGDYDAALEYYGKLTDTELQTLNYLKIGEAYFLKKKLRLCPLFLPEISIFC